MKHIILLGIIMVAATAFADTVGDKQLTSRAYVDTTLGTKQDAIPAAGKPGVVAGDTVMTYTPGGNGVIGERGIYSDAASYNVNTDGDKLITAAALHDKFNSLPTVETSTMVCANPPTCTLWTITDDTAYDPVIVMLNAMVVATSVRCYKQLSNGSAAAGDCTTVPLKYGGWGVMFTYNNEVVQVSGISTCSSLPGTYAHVASNQSAVDADYETSGSGAYANSIPPGAACYCKMTEPAESDWVYFFAFSSVSGCADACANNCAIHIQDYPYFRKALFRSVQ